MQPGSVSIAQMERRVDRELLVSLLVHDGLTVREIAPRLGVSAQLVRAELSKSPVQRLVESAQLKRLELLSTQPMANAAFRYRKYEEIMELGESVDDPDIMLKALAAARDEEKIVGGNSNENNGIQVIIGEYHAEKSEANGATPETKQNAIDAVFSRIENVVTEEKELDESTRASSPANVN